MTKSLTSNPIVAETATVTADKADYTEILAVRKSASSAVVLQLLNNDSSYDATYKIQGSVLGITYVDLEDDAETSEFTLAKTASTYKVVFEPWLYVRVVAKGDSSNNISVTVDAAGN
jgi:hypothetical protein